MLTDIGATLKVLTYRSRLNGLLAEQMLQFTRQRGIDPTYGVFGNGTTLEVLTAEVAARPICQPLDVS